MKPYLLLSLLFFTGLSSSARATLIAYENFNAAAGTDNLNGSSGTGSSGFSNNWTTIGADNSGDIVSPGYTYSGLTTAGNRASVLGDATATYYYRTLSSPFTVAANSTATLYGSFIIQATNTNAGYADIGFLSASAPTATNANNAFIYGQLGSTAAYRAGSRALDGTAIVGSSQMVSGTTVTGGTNALIVFALSINTTSGASEILSLWVNPNLAGFNGTTASLGTATLANFDMGNMNLASISSVAFGTTYTTSNGLTGLDEIRLGTALADVVAVPEPSAFALLTLGLISFFIFRRRPLRRV